MTEIYSPRAVVSPKEGHLKSKCQEGGTLQRLWRTPCLLPFLASGSCWALLSWWLHHSSLGLLHLLLSVTPLNVSQKILVFGSSTHSRNPGWSHLEILSFIISAKILFPNKVILAGSGDYNQSISFWGPTIQLTMLSKEFQMIDPAKQLLYV